MIYFMEFFHLCRRTCNCHCSSHLNYGKTGKKRAKSRFHNTAVKRVRKLCFTFYHRRSNLSGNKSGYVASCANTDFLIRQNNEGVMPYTEATSLSAKQFHLGPAKGATCTDFIVNSRTLLFFWNNVICYETGIMRKHVHVFLLLTGMTELTMIKMENSS